MPKIKLKGFIANEDDFTKGDLSESAVKMEMPETIREMQLKAFPLVIPFIAVLIAAMFCRCISYGESIIDPLFCIIGFVAGLLLLIVHELLHAVVYPKEAEVFIGFMPKQFAAVALASYPISKGRFILMSLLPMILGIIPLAVFILSPPEMKKLNGFMFGAAAIGMTSFYPDLYNVIQVVKQVPKECNVQFYEKDMYWIPKK